MTTSIPVWVESHQRWVSGITRKTTCEDVVNVLLHEDPNSSAASKGQSYAIMERWRRMERPLEGRSRILKVWNAWGDNQNEVKLTLRLIDGEADSGRGSPSREHHSHRRRKHRHKLPWPSYEALHPRRLAQMNHDGQKLPESIQRLMKLILAQGETIQSQLMRLQDREHQIEHFEDETHRTRVEKLGSNYLLETYLNGKEVEETDSGVAEGGSDKTSPISSDNNMRLRDDDDDGNFADESDACTKDLDLTNVDDKAMQELHARIEMWEKLSKVNRRLEREEENLVRLHLKCEKYSKKKSSRSSADDEESVRAKELLLREFESVRIELEIGAKELEQNSLALAESEAMLVSRHHFLYRLQAEVEATDRETVRLQAIVKSNLQKAAAPKSILKRTSASHNVITTVAVIHNDVDSNSDTGLSSLHSSSEEGVYTLDTLV